ncbi:MAG: AmmeMemoRadiSam system protein B [Candidatus Saganbacteria bacterium]|nr:AmmeMemoRadiSam system protein B [Candidatus Saganbacteria bacterium]
MGKIVYGMISPHPPILVPQIGGQRIKDAEKTKKALEAASKKLKTLNPDTVIIITPHGEISQTTVHVYSSHIFEGDFGQFGASQVKVSCKGDTELGRRIVKEASATKIFCAEIAESYLDHGIMVPLHYIQSAGFKGRLLPVAISFSSLKELFEFGRIMQSAVKASGENVAIVASADMSHRLKKDSPNGYSEKGAVFDNKLVELVKNNDVNGILNFDPVLAEQAGQDALWSIAILLGALDGLRCRHELLSYEGPYGVGYMVAKYEVDQ